MADYGHDLVFGTFLTPQAANPESVVALAQLTERVGLELATFQDHPYQNAFLDTWTLMTWVAASTETLRISPNVLNLPLRPPAVLARAAAEPRPALQRAASSSASARAGSGTRSSPWAARAAPRASRSTRSREAIDVIRQLWDVTTRRGVRVDGEHYTVKGAKRGPEPAHEIPIHLGAYKPRMLRLTGREGRRLAALAGLHAARGLRARERAHRRGGASRPAATRARSGACSTSPRATSDELRSRSRSSTASPRSSSPATTRTRSSASAQEVAPAVREAVAAERDAARARPPALSVRSPAVRAQRMTGIDYDAGAASRPSSRATARYGKVRSTYMRKGSPGLVLQPANAEEVSQALIYAREQDVPLAVRSGGHGISGRSTLDGGIVIDLGKLNAIARRRHVAAARPGRALGRTSRRSSASTGSG